MFVFFWCPGQQGDLPCWPPTGYKTSYQAALSAAGGAGAGAAITGAMEAEKTEKPRKKSKWDQASASGGGEEHLQGDVFFTPEVFFFHKKGLDIFFETYVLFFLV